jgi:transposase
MRAKRRVSESARSLKAAERGRIIQKVLVERWTAAEAAAAFGLDERLVAAWLKDYRARGMASLRESAKGRRSFLPLARAWRSLARSLVRLPWRARPAGLPERPRSPGREPSAGGDF